MLFDAHTHLNFEKYSEEERRTLASEIGESELAYLIDAAYDVASAEQAIKDAEDYTWCYAAVGLHPDQAPKYKAAATATEASRMMDEDIEKIKVLAAHPKAVAIGEIGLDYHYGNDDHEQQQELFRKQIRLANELRMPIMIHSRDAHQLTMDILKEEGAFSEERKSWFPGRPAADGGEEPDARVQLHCFSGSAELAAEYVKLGASISLGGPITFKNGKKAAEVARQIPLGYLLSETDAPYLAPEPFRGRPNKPQYIEHVVRRMALLKGLSYEETAAALCENGRRFFNL